jgi:diguanylate cyclase (GGDEF)-like protein
MRYACACLLLALLLPGAQAPVWARTQSATPQTTSPAVQQPSDAATQPQGVSLAPRPVNPRVLAGGAAATVTALILLLYFYRRRLYLLYWIVAWTLTAAAMFLAAPRYSGERMSLLAYGLSQYLSIVAALVFVLSADAYQTRPRIRRGYVFVLMPLFLWFSLGTVALGPTAAFAPGHLLIAGALTAASAAHVSLARQVRLIGAAVLGGGLVAMAGANIWMALRVPQPDAAQAGGALLAMIALYLVTAVGMQLMTFEDMTYELRRTNKRLETAQEELREMVITDSLTGCRNRRFFDEVIGRELQRHKRAEAPLSLLFVDVNHFKEVNDTLGHEAGDRVLRQVASFLVRNIREADYVFRWGGDEFLALLSADEAVAERRALAIQTAFARSKETATLPDGVGLSVGVVEVPADTKDVMRYVKMADERMYENKRASKR